VDVGGVAGDAVHLSRQRHGVGDLDPLVVDDLEFGLAGDPRRRRRSCGLAAWQFGTAVAWQRRSSVPDNWYLDFADGEWGPTLIKLCSYAPHLIARRVERAAERIARARCSWSWVQCSASAAPLSTNGGVAHRRRRHERGSNRMTTR
jgi:hypothetical protein